MNMIPVSSSDLSAVGYENNTLYIRFNKGKTYAYTGVSENIYKNLLSAPSKGKYFHAHIRNIYLGRIVG